MFDISLQGVGTGRVESLLSYLCRASYHHAVTLGVFMKYLNEEINSSYPSRRVLGKPYGTTLSALVMPGVYTIYYAGIVYKLTGRDISDSALMRMPLLVSHPLGEVSQFRKWCPECLREMRDAGVDPYLKLLWGFRSVTHCNEHHTPLMTLCPKCGKHQNRLSKMPRLDTCCLCGGSLSERDSIRIEDIDSSWVAGGEDIAKLIHDFAKHGEKMDPHSDSNIFWAYERFTNGSQLAGLHSTYKSISDLYDRMRDGGISPSLAALLESDAYERTYLYRKKISFKNVRLLAMEAGVGIHDIFTGNAGNSSLQLGYRYSTSGASYLPAAAKREAHDHDKNYKVIKELASLESPISLKDVSRRSELSLGYIKHKFPLLSKKIVDRFKRALEEEHRRKLDEASIMAFRYFNHEEFNGHPKSRKQALIFLRARSSLSKKYLKPAIQYHYEQSGLSNKN